MSCKLLVPPYNEVQLSRSRQRLEDEYDSNVIVTAPTVPYKGMQLKVLESRASADSQCSTRREPRSSSPTPQNFPM